MFGVGLTAAVDPVKGGWFFGFVVGETGINPLEWGRLFGFAPTGINSVEGGWLSGIGPAGMQAA